MIAWSLKLSKRWGFSSLIISREDKIELNSWAQQNNLDLLKIPGSAEWPESILYAKHLWRQKNLLILPDTRFAPTEMLPDLVQDLDQVDISFGVFSPPDPWNWGVVYDRSERGLSGCEKPAQGSIAAQGFAWGAIAFRANVGEELFKNLLVSTLKTNSPPHIWMMEARFALRFLKNFSDLTRSHW